MRPQKVKKIIISTVNGEEYTFIDDQADDLFNAYKGAVENNAPWIYTRSKDYTSCLQIQHIVNVHAIHADKDGDTNA